MNLSSEKRKKKRWVATEVNLYFKQKSNNLVLATMKSQRRLGSFGRFGGLSIRQHAG